MNHRLLVASVVAALTIMVGPVFAQEAAESASPESIEPKPLVEATPAPRKRSKPDADEKPVRDLQDSMTAEQFKAAGLDKLSPEELKNLNASLRGSRKEAEKKAVEQAVEKATAEVAKKQATEGHTKMDEILSRVDGEFAGVNGHTIIKLEDGTKWKQANVDDRYKARVTYHPPVKVWHGAFGYRMRVVGTGEFYVDPVRDR
jgi:hypothetical protein